jgi:hypothetical protein
MVCIEAQGIATDLGVTSLGRGAYGLISARLTCIRLSAFRPVKLTGKTQG